ncbi:TIGR02391 family protein [Pseudarthrobacter sp. H2]|uniref:TIGR02391 family protein n=1 Tax=Pseudarthrobacter sp. H2 TaxID=3418415 RepID=UPI003CECF24E
MGGSHGTKQVVIVSKPGTAEEERKTVTAMIQSGSGFFEVTTPIYDGDLVEIADPRGGTDVRMAAQVKVNDFGPSNLQHTQVKWGKAPVQRIAPVRRLTFENLHSDVQKAAGDLFADGHMASAVSEAFKSLEVRVRLLSGLDQSGSTLMSTAFSSKSPILDVATEDGRSGQDEREGFMALFRGAMIGIRNPKAHELFREEDPQQALEYLAFASLLHRRIDLTESSN